MAVAEPRPASRLVGFEAGDALLALVDASGVLLAEPGCAALTPGGLRYGTEALGLVRQQPREASQRHWRELGGGPGPAGAMPAAATLVGGHIDRLAALAGEGAAYVIATPGYWDADQAAQLAGLFAARGLPVAGLVDAAVAVARAEHPGHTPYYLEAALQGLVLTRLADGDGGAAIAAREVLSQPAVEGLQRVAAEFIARRFVDTSRFDPLHGAASEQRLFDALPGWLQRLQREPSIAAELDTDAGRFGTTVAAADLRSRLARVCEPLLQQLRATAASRGRLALLVHHRLADFPGVIETLLRVPRARVVVLEPGAAARGALARSGAVRAGGAPPVVVTQLPFDLPPASGDHALTAGASGGTRPTHLLYGHRAWRLGAEPFLIGLELQGDERGVALDAGARGVSRRHCTLRAEDGALLVFDHSRFGTLLNGHRIQGAAVLEAGDVLLIGSPPAEFRLIAEEAAHGPA